LFQGASTINNPAHYTTDAVKTFWLSAEHLLISCQHFFFLCQFKCHSTGLTKPGEVRIETDTGVESIYVSGGIVEVQPNVVTIFSDTAIRASDLNEAKLLITAIL
jgi:hypothetical protein